VWELSGNDNPRNNLPDCSSCFEYQFDLELLEWLRLATPHSLSITLGETNNIVNAVTRLEKYLTAFTLDLVITNDSPSQTVTITHYWLEIPWNDECLRPLDDPDERGEKLYRFPGTALEYTRDMVINHRRYGLGRLAPGEPITGMFLVQGTAEIPFDLYRGSWIPVTVAVLDASGKLHKSKDIAIWPHPNDPTIGPPVPPNPVVRRSP
jgi:hypothetical protein